MEGDKMGNGSTSPFGNGQGATASGPATKGNDFVKNPSGSGSKAGGNNFVTNPSGNGDKSGGRDFTEDPGGDAQASGEAPDLNEGTVPAGGRILKRDPEGDGFGDIGVGSIGSGRKPFKLNG